MDRTDHTIHEHIEKFGWHVALIPEDEVGPAFAFSVGLVKSFNHPEILIVGLNVQLMHQMINGIGDEVKAGKRFSPGHKYPGFLEGHECLFQTVDEKFYRDYLGTATAFYRGKDFPVLQCLWPDMNGVFPGEPEFPDNLLVRQTLGTGCPHKIPNEDWPFQDVTNTAVFTTKRVLFEKYPILLVIHDEEGEWQFLCGIGNEMSQLAIVGFGRMLAKDRTLAEIADLPVGWEATRETVAGPWTRRKK